MQLNDHHKQGSDDPGALPLQQPPVGSEVRVASEGELMDPREERLDGVAQEGAGGARGGLPHAPSRLAEI